MIPTAVLRDRVTIHPYVGTSSEGADVFGEPIERVPARIVDRQVRRRTATGADVLTLPVCQLRPRSVPVQSVIVRGPECWEVSEVAHSRELGRAHHLDLILDGPRPTPPEWVDPEPEPEP